MGGTVCYQVRGWVSDQVQNGVWKLPMWEDHGMLVLQRKDPNYPVAHGFQDHMRHKVRNRMQNGVTAFWCFQMRNSLADNLSLAGIADFNLSIRE